MKLIHMMAALIVLLMTTNISLAVVVSTTTAISTDAYTDLGTGPISLVVLNGSLLYQVADTQPLKTSAAVSLSAGISPVVVSTSSHIWALAVSGGNVSTLTWPATQIVYDPTVNASVQATIPLNSNGTIGPVSPAPPIQLGPYSCSSACAGTFIVPATATQGMASLQLQVTGAGSGVNAFLETTDDPACSSNWTSTSLPATGAIAYAFGATSIFTNLNFTGTTVFPVAANCIRVAISTYSSGTYSITGFLSPAKAPMNIYGGEVKPILGTANGWTPLYFNALTNAAQAIKSSAGELGELVCSNPNASFAYVQVFNVAFGSVTLGSTTPTQSFGIPASTSFVAVYLSNPGINFSTAISLAATTTTNGSTAPGTALTCNVAYN